MNAARLGLLLAACAIATGWSGAAESARKKPEPTLGALAGRSAPIDRSQAVQAAPEDAASSYEAFLRIEGADPALKAQALRRVGDLRLEQAAALSAADAESDAAAQARAREAVTAYQQLLREHPDYAARDAVLYQLARASEVAGDSDAALAALDELVARHPQGAHADEAQFRRGEAFFSAQRYADAAQAYGAVLAMGPASTFHEQALYKRGWAQFKLGEDAASSRDFLALLDTLLVQDGQLRDAAQLTRPEQELSDDTLRALSLMFAADAGAVSLQSALASRGPAPYESRLYRALGDLYVEKERFQDGAEVYRSFARRQPRDPEAPILLGKATEAYGKAGFTALVLESKQELVELYGPRSAYWAERGAGIDPRVSGAVQANLLDLAQHHHALAQKQGSAADRDAAVRWYREYLDGFDATAGGAGHAAAAGRPVVRRLALRRGRRRVRTRRLPLPGRARGRPRRLRRAGCLRQGRGDAAGGRAPRAAPARHRLGAALCPGLPAACRDAGRADPHDQAAVRPRRSRAGRVRGAGRAGAGPARRRRRSSWSPGRCSRIRTSIPAATPRLSAPTAKWSRGHPRTDALHAESVERQAAAIYRQAETRQAAGDAAGAVQDFLRIASGCTGLADPRQGRVRCGHAAARRQAVERGGGGPRRLPPHLPGA